MLGAFILFCIAGVYFHIRVGRADKFARGQCRVYRQAIKIHTAAVKPARSTPNTKDGVNIGV